MVIQKLKLDQNVLTHLLITLTMMDLNWKKTLIVNSFWKISSQYNQNNTWVLCFLNDHEIHIKLPTFHGLNLLCIDLYLHNIDSIYHCLSILWNSCIKETFDSSVSLVSNFVFDIFQFRKFALLNNVSIQQMIFTGYLKSSRINHYLNYKMRLFRSVSCQSGKYLKTRNVTTNVQLTNVKPLQFGGSFLFLGCQSQRRSCTHVVFSKI